MDISEMASRIGTAQVSEEERVRQAKVLRKWQADQFNRQEGKLHYADGFSCPSCKNRGLIAEYFEEFELPNIRYHLCDCDRVRKAIQRLKNSGLENVTQKYRFDNFIATEGWQKTMLDAAKGYMEDPKAWFYIGGQPGCGKTHICSAMAVEYIRRGMPVLYSVWNAEINGLRSKQGEEGYAERLEELSCIPVLYLDDLFKHGGGADPTSYELTVAFHILNKRYLSGLPTIMSSEMPLQKLTEIDEAVGSRIEEMCRGKYNLYIGHADGRNYRQK